MPVQIGQVWVLGSAPKAAEHPQKILLPVKSCAWTSSPMTVSYSTIATLYPFALAGYYSAPTMSSSEQNDVLDWRIPDKFGISRKL